MIKKFTLLLLAMLCIAGTSQSKENVIFLGDHAIGKWTNDLNIGKDAFSALTSGDAITIQYEPDVDAATIASELYYQIKLYSVGTLCEDNLLSSGYHNYVFNPTDEQITTIKDNGITFQGHFYKIKRILYGPTPSGTSLADISGSFDVGEWEYPLSLEASKIKEAAVGDQIVFTISETYTKGERGWCEGHIYYNDGSSYTELLGDGSWKDETTKVYFLTDDEITKIGTMVSADFVGKGVKVSAIELIHHDVDYYLTSHSNIDFSKVPNKDVSVKFVRTFNYWNTLCLPFDWDIPAEFTNVYTYNSFDSGEKTIYFDKVTSGSVSAGTPCLVEASVVEVTFSETANIYNASPNTSTAYKGNYTPGASMENKYGVAYSTEGEDQWAFIKGSSSSTAKAFSAYFKPSVATTRGFTFDTGDGTTSIRQIEKNSEGDGIMYSLSGARISSPKGIYIKDGKKYITK